jgi:hypothetical protein
MDTARPSASVTSRPKRFLKNTFFNKYKIRKEKQDNEVILFFVAKNTSSLNLETGEEEKSGGGRSRLGVLDPAGAILVYSDPLPPRKLDAFG